MNHRAFYHSFHFILLGPKMYLANHTVNWLLTLSILSFPSSMFYFIALVSRDLYNMRGSFSPVPTEQVINTAGIAFLTTSAFLCLPKLQILMMLILTSHSEKNSFLFFYSCSLTSGYEGWHLNLSPEDDIFWTSRAPILTVWEVSGIKLKVLRDYGGGV